ncbi:hypothetical protein ACIRQQ_22385 [Streptomyces fuscichromogenes]|uniref:hypothetical protein n=1 Tax=Streptomyces fuscichromogenes TaxID=1324013 RepID=UPI0037F49B0D
MSLLHAWPAEIWLGAVTSVFVTTTVSVTGFEDAVFFCLFFSGAVAVPPAAALPAFAVARVVGLGCVVVFFGVVVVFVVGVDVGVVV